MHGVRFMIYEIHMKLIKHRNLGIAIQNEKDKGGGIYRTKAVAECIEPDRFRSLCCELISGKCLKP